MREEGEREKSGLGYYQIKKHVLDNAPSSSFIIIIIICILQVDWGSSIGKPWAGILDETFENRQRKIGNQKMKGRK